MGLTDTQGPRSEWGRPGTPVLPATLRNAWRDQRLPDWLAIEAGLPIETRLDQLDENVWSLGFEFTPRLEHYLLSLTADRRSEIADLPVLQSQSWPVGLLPDEVPWGARVRNAVRRAHLLELPNKLAILTFGEVFALPAIGTKSVLEFASILEAAVGSMPDGARPTDSSVIVESFDPRLLDESWIDMVSSEDPRFSSVLPGGWGTVGDRLESALVTDRGISGTPAVVTLIRSLPSIVARVNDIARQPLDIALREYVLALSGQEGDRLDALVARLGFDGQPRRTLAETAKSISVTRERMRQLESKFKERLPSHPAFMPALDEAIDLLTSESPLEAERAAVLLRDTGLSSTPFHPHSVVAAAELCGRPITFRVERFPKGERVVTSSGTAHARQIIAMGSRQAASVGLSNVAEVKAAAELSGLNVQEAEVMDVLEHHSGAQFLGDQWFWMPERSPDRNRLRNVTRAMLSVVSPISVSTIREGVRRRYRFRGIPIIPPRDVLLDFYRAHPEFEVVGDDKVGTVQPLDYRVELGSTERAFVEVLRNAPAGVLDRASFESGVLERGVNANTFSVYTTYSPVIDHLGIDIWALRGVQIDPSAVQALRKANAQRPRERRVQDYGWTPSGRLWLAVRVAGTSSIVIGIPSAISPYVVDRRFPAKTEDGSQAGEVVVGENGTSWGYGPFLSRMGADEGDILRIEFDLVNEVAHLVVGGEDLIDGADIQ